MSSDSNEGCLCIASRVSAEVAQFGVDSGSAIRDCGNISIHRLQVLFVLNFVELLPIASFCLLCAVHICRARPPRTQNGNETFVIGSCLHQDLVPSRTAYIQAYALIGRKSLEAS